MLHIKHDIKIADESWSAGPLKHCYGDFSINDLPNSYLHIEVDPPSLLIQYIDAEIFNIIWAGDAFTQFSKHIERSLHEISNPQ